MAAEKQAKRWYVIIADDKPLGIVLEGTPPFEKARKEYDGLLGIEFYPALPEHLKQFASTVEAYNKKKADAAEKRRQRR